MSIECSGIEKVEIEIKNSTDDGGETPVAGADHQGGGTVAPGVTPSERNMKKTANFAATAAGVVAISNQIKPYVSQMINFRIGQMSVTTGQVEQQQRIQAYSSIASSGLGIISAAVIGGPIAAATAAAMTAVQSIISYAYQTVSINNQKRIEDENIELRKSRIGLNVNRSRGGEVS